MDKYEYKVKWEEIQSLIKTGDLEEAAEIADTIDWRKVRSVKTLCTISDVYKYNRKYEDAKALLQMAYYYRPGGRNICYSLCELCIKTGDLVHAMEYYKEFVSVAPKDPTRFILQYKLYEDQDVSLEERIEVLENLKKEDYREKWAYELAYLYHRIGLATRCVEECDQLILWFGEGPYVIKAMELKMLHQPLSPEQQEIYDHRFEEFLEEDEGQRTAAAEHAFEASEAPTDVSSEKQVGGDTAVWPKKAVQEKVTGDTMVYQPVRAGEMDRSAQDSGTDRQQGLGDSEKYVQAPAGGLEDEYAEEGHLESGEYGEDSYSEGGHGEDGYLADDGYGEDGYPADDGYGEDGYPEDNGYAEDGYSEDGGYAEGGYSEDGAYAEDETYAADGSYDADGKLDNGEDFDIHVKTMDVGKYNTINLQAELAQELKQFLEEQTSSEVFFGATGEINADLAHTGRFQELQGAAGERMEPAAQDVSGAKTARQTETVQDVMGVKVAGQAETMQDAAGAKTARQAETVQDAAGVKAAVQAETVQDAAGAKATRHLEAEEALSEVSAENGQKPVVDAKAPTEEMSEAGGDSQSGETASTYVMESATEGEGSTTSKNPRVIMPSNSTISNIEKKMAQIQPPKEMAHVLSQEADGQLRIVLPERNRVEKQITGQMDIEDVLAEWERMKKENEEKRKEEVRQHVRHHTGNMFTEFEASVRDGLLRQLEKGELSEETADVDEAESSVEDTSVRKWREDKKAGGTAGADEGRLTGTADADVEDDEVEELQEIDDIEDLEKADDTEEFAAQEDLEDIEEPEFAAQDEDVELSDEEYAEDLGTDGEDAELSDEEYAEDLGTDGEDEGLSDEEYAEDLGTDGEDAELSDEEYAEDLGIDGEDAEPSDEEYAEDLGTDGEDAELSDEEYAEDLGIDGEDAELSDEEYAEDLGTDGEDAEPSDEEDTEAFEVDGEDAEVSEEDAKGVSAGSEDAVDARSAGGTGQAREADGEAAAEAKGKVRALTREERENFGDYIQNKATKEQLVKALDNITLAAYTGNVIITGKVDVDTIPLAKKIIREVQATDSNFSGQVAKISGNGLNHRSVSKTLEHLQNGALIIQEASGMSEKTAADLHKALQKENLGIVVLLQDDTKSMNQFIKKNEFLLDAFPSRIDVKALSNGMLVSYGKQYALDQEYAIDDLGILALHNRIEKRQTIDHAVTTGEVKEIVDAAIRHAKRRTVGHFVDILIGKRYDEEDMIIVTEKDFN